MGEPFAVLPFIIGPRCWAWKYLEVPIHMLRQCECKIKIYFSIYHTLPLFYLSIHLNTPENQNPAFYAYMAWAA